LGSTNYLQALPTEKGEDFLPDIQKLERSLEYYDLALESEHQPITADIPSKVAFGKGVIYLTLWLSGQETMDLAVENFEIVIEEYEQNDNQRMQEAASEAHAHLGLIARQNQDIETAINEYNSAINSATNPARRGLYWSVLGNLFQNQNELATALDYYDKCVVEYTTAIKLTTQAERRAGYWEKIATCQEGLGNKKHAIDALKQAMRYSTEGTDEYIKYETELNRLQTNLGE
jgi:tetratricopeptide (TPR) repeat protein